MTSRPYFQLAKLALCISPILISTNTFAAVSSVEPEQSMSEINHHEVITVTASRSEQLLSEVAKDITVINQTSLSQIDHSHIQQVFNRYPGVNFHRNSGQEYLAAIRSPVLTGAGACGSFLMMENGIPLRPTGFCNVNELFESHHEAASRIELLRGPSTPYFGSNGLHGIVNVVTPASIYNPDKVRVSVGENDFYALGLTASTQGSNASNSSLALNIIDDGGFRDSTGTEQQKISLSHEQETNIANVEKVATYFTGFNLDQNTAGYLVGEDAYEDKYLITTNPNPEAYRKAYGWRASQAWQFDNGLTIKPFARFSKMDFLQHFLPGQPTEKSQQYSLGTQSQFTGLTWENGSLNIGVDGEYAKVKLHQYQLSPTQGSAFLQETVPQGDHYDYQVDVISTATFAQVNQVLTDNLLLTTGVRLEYSHYDYDNKMLAGRTRDDGSECGFGGCRYARPESRKDSFTNLSPKLGLNYTIDSAQQAYINISQGFRVPQTTELYRLQRAQQVADLDSENIRGVEGAWRYSGEQAAISLSGYWFNKYDVILRDRDFYNISGGETSHRGVEMSFDYQLNPAFKLSGNSSYSIHQYENNPGLSAQDIVGNDVDTAPRLTANGFINFEREQWWAELHLQHMGSYYLEPENEHRYDGHLLVNARTRYQLNAAMSIQLHILNLTDERYAERADYTGFTGYRYFPGQERNLKVSIDYLW